MIITIMNNADVPGKYERKIKWLLYNLREKFNEIVYVKVFFNKEGSLNPLYKMNMVVGLPGNDLVIKNTGAELTKLISQVYNSAKHNIAKRLNARR